MVRFIANGKRLMKGRNIMEEVEKSIEDKQERTKVLEGLLGYILTSTQVFSSYYHQNSLKLYTLFFSYSCFSCHGNNIFCTKLTKKKNLKKKKTQEAAVVPPYVALAIRPNPGYWEHVKVNADDLVVQGISASEFLKYKETIFDEEWYVPSTFNETNHII